MDRGKWLLGAVSAGSGFGDFTFGSRFFTINWATLPSLVITFRVCVSSGFKLLETLISVLVIVPAGFSESPAMPEDAVKSSTNTCSL